MRGNADNDIKVSLLFSDFRLLANTQKCRSRHFCILMSLAPSQGLSNPIDIVEKSATCCKDMSEESLLVHLILNCSSFLHVLHFFMTWMTLLSAPLHQWTLNKLISEHWCNAFSLCWQWTSVCLGSPFLDYKLKSVSMVCNQLRSLITPSIWHVYSSQAPWFNFSFIFFYYFFVFLLHSSPEHLVIFSMFSI